VIVKSRLALLLLLSIGVLSIGHKLTSTAPGFVLSSPYTSQAHKWTSVVTRETQSLTASRSKKQELQHGIASIQSDIATLKKQYTQHLQKLASEGLITLN